MKLFEFSGGPPSGSGSIFCEDCGWSIDAVYSRELRDEHGNFKPCPKCGGHLESSIAAASRAMQHHADTRPLQLPGWLGPKLESRARVTIDQLVECSGRCTNCGVHSDDLRHFGKGNVLCSKCSKNANESQLFERNWLMGLGVDLSSAEYEDLAFEEIRDAVVAKLKAKEQEVGQHRRIPRSAFEEYKAIVSDMSHTSDEEEFDSYMNDLYDWADRESVWMGELTPGDGGGYKGEQGTIEL